ncbi:hypothetical protein J2X11_000856 [Aeromicrobium panaciterrae]|uniref:Esterase-like activity of phytase family protein n=1 Tax=Aeromicrobium panaciterrae TaxID=363861 RepID=A0ABU1ULH5_9ACTN|nr:hypothetical protein [Aeromicrobium panaciterrae]MDR7086017.1 hypothetical protein [Aeromicrobium panaciterrae]
MNPRYRRLLIPGLLVLLLVVVIVSSLARRADGAEAEPQVVSRMNDPRITESSGLAVSRSYDGIVYTINDSGNDPLIFAIELKTGRTVGVTRVEGGTLSDTEALAIDSEGTLWVADTGDNLERRKDAALYALPEQGPGNHTVVASRYPISYDADSHNVEALLVHPVTGAKLLVSKALLSGTIYKLPTTLSTDRTNLAVAQKGTGPSAVTDATYTSDGKYAVMRTYASMYLFDAAKGTLLNGVRTPDQKQGETIAAEARSLLVGSEGSDSELIRVPIPSATPEPTPTPTDASKPTPEQGDDLPVEPMLFVFGAVGAAVILGVGVAIRAKRSRRVVSD